MKPKVYNCFYCGYTIENKYGAWVDCSKCYGNPQWISWPSDLAPWNPRVNYLSGNNIYFRVTFHLRLETVYRIDYFPNTNMAYVYRVSNNSIGYLFSKIRAPNLQPNNLMDFLNRLLQLKAFL